MQTEKYFEAIGARLFFQHEARLRQDYALDIRSDKRGEHYLINYRSNIPQFKLLQSVPAERHLLMMEATDKHRFLCGHDERHWFVAAISDPVSTVIQAKRSLMPAAVAAKARNIRSKDRLKRKNDAYVRQGEWFFTPVSASESEVISRSASILKNEPLQRNAGSKPHMAEELYRSGGELIYIVGMREYTEVGYKAAVKANSLPKFRSGIRTMYRNPRIVVRGKIRHPDHKTVVLKGWHEVSINQERTDSGVISWLD